MAPSVKGQASVVRKAIEKAGIHPETISYIETHGTGTKIGDPVEVTALASVFRNGRVSHATCAIGSIKGNIGHLDAAAGVTGVIKVILMLRNRKLVPLVNFRSPNPELPLEDSPFYINTSFKEWTPVQGKRIAGVSSFGIGGTNAHCILEEAPEIVTERSAPGYHLLPVTARTQKALDLLKKKTQDLVRTSNHDIADTAFTLQQGRTHFKYRSLLVALKNSENEAAEITCCDISGVQELINPGMVFMFTGQGSQYPGMTKGLYREFETYRTIIDTSSEYLKENFGIDLLKFILSDDSEELREEINQTSVTQPLLFVVQYGIAKLLEKFGIRPDAVIGHSIGEYAAACLAGVMEFKDALRLVCHRGILMQAQEPGEMIAVHLPVEKILPFVNHKVSIALKNAPGLNVVSGRRKDIEDFSKEILNNIPDTRISEIKTSHAFHSYLMDPVLDPFSEVLRNVKFGECSIPFVSNLTGTWVTGDEISCAGYWLRQIREPVNFAGGIQELLRSGNSYFLEVGPGNSLAALLSRFRNENEKINVSSTSRHPGRAADDVRVFFEAAGQAWVRGVNIKWDDLYKNEKRYRVPLPSYPFERKRHWIDPKAPFSYFAECPAMINAPGEKYSQDEETGNENLPDAHHLRPEMETGYVAPVTDNEKIVVKIWEDLLGISGIGIDDDFFVLGGHSLLASQVITRIREKMFVRLDLEAIFSAPTIREIMTKIEAAPQLKTGDYKIISLNQSGKLPISFDQKRLWILNQIDQNNPAYNIPFTYHLKGHLDVNVFTRSLKVLFDRQAILRSSIRSAGGEPFCMLNSYETIPVTILDFTHYTAYEAEKVIQEYFAAESRKKFDIENGPLFRLFLVKLNETEHIFHMTVQHMIFDGWSWGIFAGELRQIYNDNLNNRPVGLRPLQLQYYDLASWQNRNINRNSFSDSIVYWKEQLKDHPSEINFPFDQPRSRDISGFGGRESLRLSKDLSDRIIALSCRENSTVFMTMLSAFGLLLHKYSGDDDICIGVPTANRENTATEQLIGLFVNTIIIRLRFDRSLTFAGLLRAARKTTLDALAHQDLPFEILVDELHPERKINVNPVTQILFAYQNTPRPALDLEGIVPERVLIIDTVSPFDLTFYAWEAEGIIEGEIEFNSDLIDRNSVARMKENLVSLLESAIDDPEQMISEIPVVSDHCRKILEGFNNTGVPVPDCLVHNFFEEQAARDPDKTAVISGTDILTYRELNEHAGNLSSRLKALGAAPGNVVGIFLERSAGMIEAVLGILKAGCCYLPLDPALPQERLRYMVGDSGTGIIISAGSLRDRFVHFPGITFILPEDLENPSHPSEGDESDKTAGPDSPAYMIYTSGTTGRPKGVKVHHRAVVNLVKSMSKTPGISARDKLLAVVTLSFDMSVFEMFLPLSNGATIVMAGSRDVNDGQALRELIDRHDITVIQATPSLWSIILADGWKGKPGLKALSGGESLTPNLIKQLLPKTGELWNCYGPTETTVYSTCARIQSADSKVVIGKPVDNTKIFILDKYGKILPPGVTGEMAIAGTGVTGGYNNQPGLTSEKFITTDDYDVVYKTGDLGRFLEDGNIELFGRNDYQVKIRGFRIELREIELLLSGIRGVNEVVIKLHRFGDNDERLIGFLETNDDFKIEPCEINNLLKEKLPSYMLPYTYRIMKEFPRTHNGKIDRKALLFRLEDLGGDGNGRPENLTAVEKKIYEFWCDALKTDNIKVTDNFFDIGGNSLMAISMFSKISNAFNTNIPLRVFFDSPRIRDLADIVEVTLNKPHEIHSQDQKKIHGSKMVIGEV
jgi:amino acid adenylation domain-containing protein